MLFISDVDISNKRVILRCDFNVPIENEKVLDNTKIKKSVKTIKYLLDNNNSVILMSHLGRIKNKEDKEKYTLKPVITLLEELLNKNIQFASSPVGMKTLAKVKKLKKGELLLIENTRYCDFPTELESKSDIELSRYWSKFGDVFVVDAFGSLHRTHASVTGISDFLPTYFGFLVKEELDNLSLVTKNINHPFGIFMGGAKVDDKLKYIKNLLTRCDYLLVGGGIANSFLYASGYDVGDSLKTESEEVLSELKVLLNKYKEKIVLPIDFVIDNQKILDLNIKSIAKYLRYMRKCKTIFINGTCGVFEDEKYAKGTKNFLEGIASINAIKIAGGGDAINAINKFNLGHTFTFLSSGGGASLEYISSLSLEAISYILSKKAK